MLSTKQYPDIHISSYQFVNVIFITIFLKYFLRIAWREVSVGSYHANYVKQC